ncbi:DISARM system helicase DrmA [Nannocystaceae bacterium ST9]
MHWSLGQHRIVSSRLAGTAVTTVLLSPVKPVEARTKLVTALELDLIGPRSGDKYLAAYLDERLPERPMSWYLTGFLVPFEASADERTGDDIGDEIEVEGRRGNDDDTAPDATSGRKAFLPSTMGLSTLVPAGVERLAAKARWGDYEQVELPEAGVVWQRIAREASTSISVSPGSHRERLDCGVEGKQLELVVSVREVPAEAGLPAGTRVVSLFVVNNRPPSPKGVPRDLACAFQVELEIRSPAPLVPRPDRRGKDGDDWDEAVAELQYRDAFEYAVGHNVAVAAEREADGSCRVVKTQWMPRAEVEKVVATSIEGVELGMEALADAKDAASLQAMLTPLVERYGAWLATQQVEFAEPKRAKTATELLRQAELARKRMQRGIELLTEPDALAAFQLANRAVATAMRQRLSHDDNKQPKDFPPPKWHPFQLAFILLNLVGIAKPTQGEREIVDLLFFPTGGGKTEAYLGLAAFTLVLRRLGNPGLSSAGVTVLMRYTLRLLTLDQLGRAATLICALELERERDVDRLGKWPFEIGLWVGSAATPNVMGSKNDKRKDTARARTIAFQNQPKRKPSPIPLEVCPWCGHKFVPDSFRLEPAGDSPRNLVVRCANRRCEFTRNRALPILAVDEPIYRRVPCFLIATVDKFAALPWVGPSGLVLGGATHHDQHGFYGPAEPGYGRKLERPLLPPELIIQDELHLISGPLGTMVGLYETAIDALATREVEGKRVRPKIVASTATVRRAAKQIQALFTRDYVDVFPPPGPDRRDSFFAKTVRSSERNARLYVGIPGQGRSLKVVMLRSYLALLGAAERVRQIDADAADPYMTLLGYFNSLRELGGSRRIVEDEVNARLGSYGKRLRVGETLGLFADRKIDHLPRELTSRVPTNEVAETKDRLKLRFAAKERIDVALATNMISVGLDITRLGLMVVLGQPKSASEYIQATSRVGRDDERPGLVVTLLNMHKARDRSHYEHFEAWHESFYRAVEATSVTPFSPRALDRGLAGVTVTLARHGVAALAPSSSAGKVKDRRDELDFVCDLLGDRAEAHDNLAPERRELLRTQVRDRSARLLDVWSSLATEQDAKGAGLRYQAFEPGNDPPLLHDPTDPELGKLDGRYHAFRAARSLRDVEPSVNLWIRTPDGHLLDIEEDER